MLIDLTLGACQNVHIKKTVSVRGQSILLKAERSQNSIPGCAPAFKIDLQAHELTTRSEASVSTQQNAPEASMENQQHQKNNTTDQQESPPEDIPADLLLRDLTPCERETINEIRRAWTLRETQKQKKDPLPNENSGNE